LTDWGLTAISAQGYIVPKQAGMSMEESLCNHIWCMLLLHYHWHNILFKIYLVSV